jgi:hypothetical protein
VFSERLFLTGDWVSTDDKIKKQFGTFSKESGEYDCAFMQDTKSNNYIIF